jgi:viroplasmin and RNaseH domain-containing protein
MSSEPQDLYYPFPKIVYSSKIRTQKHDSKVTVIYVYEIFINNMRDILKKIYKLRK